MVGDSDKEILLTGDEGREDDPFQVTAQELRRLRAQERQRQLAQNPGGFALQAEEDEDLDKTIPMLTGPQPAPSPPPMAAPAPVPRYSVPPAPQPHNVPTGPFRPNLAGSAPLSGWHSIRRHSHWLIPVLLGLIFFFLVLLVHPWQAGAMAFIFAAIGVVQAAVLLYAPNDAFWAVGVVGGFLVFVSATFFIFFLPIFAVILSILLLSLGGVALRERYFPVKEGTVAVMGLFGRYNRTLQPGFNLRIPGEKLLGVVETQSLRHETRVPPITLTSGEQITLGVAMTYQVVPGEEHLAIRLTRDWQKPIQQQLQAVVQDEVSLLSIQDFRPAGGPSFPPAGYAADDAEADQDTTPLERVNMRLTNAMSMKVADRGVAVHEVKVRLLGPTLVPGAASAAQKQMPASFHQAPSAHPTVALPLMTQGVGQATEGAMPGAPNIGPAPLPAAPAGMAGYPAPSAYPPGQPIAPPAPGAGGPQVAAQAESMTLMSAQALAEAYDAVLRHRITDMATIQRIISQFEAVAADPELSQAVPFDAAAGARYLSDHLQHLQMRSLSMLSQQQGGDVSYPADDAPALPDDEEED
jgi:hypothetical protein